MRADVEGLIEQVVTGLGYELVDIEFSPKGRLLRVFLDIERGINGKSPAERLAVRQELGAPLPRQAARWQP